MSMMDTYKAITSTGGGDSPIKGVTFKIKQDCENDYYHDQLPVIPAGTPIVADFAGEFGMYGLVEVNGVLHKVKINLHELHKVDFGSFDARVGGVE